MAEEYALYPHTVNKNDTLVGISLKYNMKPADVKKLNKLYNDQLWEGQIVNVRVKKSILATLPAPPSQEPPASNNPLIPSSPLLPHATSPKPVNELKLSSSVTQITSTLQMDETDVHNKGISHDRSEIWHILGMPQPGDVVNCYARYLPVHETQVAGMLTITPTRVIFEPSLDDPEVKRDGVLAHQFSVETSRLVEVEMFSDAKVFHDRLKAQLEKQAWWDERERPRTKHNKKTSLFGKLMGKSKSTDDEITHFDPATEQLLQIVCLGRFRPKNYAIFVLPKEKGEGIYQKLIVFLSGSKEERLKAYLNLDVSAPPKKPVLRRQHSFNELRSNDIGAVDIIATIRRAKSKPNLGLDPEVKGDVSPRINKEAEKTGSPPTKKEGFSPRKKEREKAELSSPRKKEGEKVEPTPRRNSDASGATAEEKKSKWKREKSIEDIEADEKKRKAKLDAKQQEKELRKKEKELKAQKEEQQRKEKEEKEQRKAQKEKERAEKERADREKAEKEKAEKERAEKRADKDKRKAMRLKAGGKSGSTQAPVSPRSDQAQGQGQVQAQAQGPSQGQAQAQGPAQGQVQGQVQAQVQGEGQAQGQVQGPGRALALSDEGFCLVPSASAAVPAEKPVQPSVPEANEEEGGEWVDVPSQSSRASAQLASELSEEFQPVMRDESLLVGKKDMLNLRRHLPGFLKWMDWKLLYCTQTHGISFHTFLSRVRNFSPTLLVVEDSNGFVFGGFCTAPWALSTGYFGTGQSFLFSLKPKFHIYEWTRTNQFFMQLTHQALAMGGDKEGRYGLWLDSNFENGVSEVCGTYFNRCLASTERFKCTVVEVWSFCE